MLKSNRKKILVFVDWFEPAFKGGGPIRSCVNFAYHMKSDYEIFVFTGDRDLGDQKAFDGIVANQWMTPEPGVHVFYASPGFLNWRNIRSVVRTVSPDFIYLNHLFSAWYVIVPLLVWWRNFQKSIVLVLSPRGALFDSAMHFKNTFVKKILLIRVLRMLGLHKKIRFHATNESERKAVLRYFPGAEVSIANNLPAGKQSLFQTIDKKEQSLSMIIVSRVVNIKNHLFLLNVLGKIKHHAIELSIVGPIEDSDYWAACQAEIATLPPNITVNYVGSLENDALFALIRQHHLFVLPTLGENFGHSIFESFLAGRPVLVSDQTPWRGLQELHVGWDLPLEIHAFQQAIEEAAGWDQQAFDTTAFKSWSFAKTFLEQPSLKKDYLELFS